MMAYQENVNKIISKILEDARAQGGEIIARGKEEADRIIEDARQKAKRIEELALRDAGREAEQEKRRIMADATIKARKLKLAAREEVISEAFKRAEEELQKIAKSPSYAEILVKLAAQACTEIGGGKLEILVREEDKNLAQKSLSRIEDPLNKSGLSAELSVASASIGSPGAVVRTKDGKVEVANTFASRYERMRSSLRLEAAKILFGA